MKFILNMYWRKNKFCCYYCPVNFYSAYALNSSVFKKRVFWYASQTRHSFGKLKLSSSQTLLITQCPLQQEELKMWNIKYLHAIPLEEGRREWASFAFSEPRLRSFTICKQVCIVLACTNFATTGDLSPQKLMQASEWKFTYISNERSLVSIKSVECRALRGPGGGSSNHYA